MKKDKLMIVYLNEKIELLEVFIMESADLAQENGWETTEEQMERLNELSTELDKITEKIINLENVKE